MPVLVRRRSSERSAHTGRELTELHVCGYHARPETHRRLSAALPAIGERPSARLAGRRLAGKWQVSWNSYAESEGIHSYT